MPNSLKPLYWVGSSKKDLLLLPQEVVDVFGYALHLAQDGKKHVQAKLLKGFGEAGVLEVVEDTWAMPIAQLTQSRLPMGCMCCIVFRKNLPVVLPPLNPISI